MMDHQRLSNLTLPRPGIFSMTNQIRYVLLMLTGLSLLVTAGILIYLSFQTQQQQLQVAQQERSRAAAAEINTYLADLQSELGYLAQVPGLATLSPQLQEDLLEGLTGRNSAYELVAILDHTAQVKVLVSPYGQTIADNLAGSPLFLQAFEQQEDYAGPVEKDAATGLSYVLLARPIRDPQGKVDGVLLARINLEFLWFVTSQIEVGQTGYAYIIDNHNLLAAEEGNMSETHEMDPQSDHSAVPDLIPGMTDGLTPYQGLKGTQVLGALAPIPSRGWQVVVELPTAEAFAPIRRMLLVGGSVFIVTMLVAVGLANLLSQRIVEPLQRLIEASIRLGAGDMATRVDINNRNELGILATTFNEMAARLNELYATLEQRVIDRTQRLELVASISERLMTILNLDQLLTQLVNQVQEKFDYYHTLIYLFDATQEQLVVVAGAGPAGAELKTRGHHIPLTASPSLIAHAARTGEIVAVDNVRQAADWLPNPLLPETCSEMAVPIILAGQVVGVLDVQVNEIAGLDEGDADLLRSLANQVAVAIRNARLFDEVETALANARALQERYTEQSWEKTKIMAQGGQYHYSRPNAPPLDEVALIEARRLALAQNQPAIVMIKPDNSIPERNRENALERGNPQAENRPSGNSTAKALVAPIIFHDKTIGTLQMHPAGDHRAWTPEDLAVVEAVLDQLAQAAENLRLFDETRQRVAYEQITRQITDKMRTVPDMETIIQTGLAELAKVLGVSRTYLKLSSQPQQTRAATVASEVGRQR